MMYVIRVQTACAREAIKVLAAAERAAAKLGLPSPVGTFEQGPPPAPPAGPPPPVCAPGEDC